MGPGGVGHLCPVVGRSRCRQVPGQPLQCQESGIFASRRDIAKARGLFSGQVHRQRAEPGDRKPGVPGEGGTLPPRL